MERLKSVLIGIGIVAFVAVLFWKVVWTDLQDHKKAEDTTKALAAAIEANDPGAAPTGGAGYVRGVREQFGRVREARFLDAYTERSGSGKTATTEILAEIMVRGKRGAGVLELEFDRDGGLDDVEELSPDEVHTDLKKADAVAVKRGFARRGGEVARTFVLDGSQKRNGDWR